MSKVPFEFFREFRHWARGHCVLCQALALFVHPAGRRAVSEDVAAEAEAKGAGRRLASLDGDDAQ